MAEIEQVRLDAALFERLHRDLRQPEALGHLARAGAVVARRRRDHQHARGQPRVLLHKLGALDRLARRAPVVGKIVVGIGGARPGLVRARRFARGAIGLPRDVLDARQRGPLAVEHRVLERCAEALAERHARKLVRRLAFADFGHESETNADAFGCYSPPG